MDRIGALKVLTVRQPFATRIALGRKRYETRSWWTSYRGELAIHAGQAKDHVPAADVPGLVFGAVVAVVELVDCVPTGRVSGELSDAELAWGDFSPGRWAWELRNVRRVEPPVAAVGRQGLWVLADRAGIEPRS